MSAQSEAYKKWQERCEQVSKFTASFLRPETDAEKRKNIARARKDYAYFCQRYFPHYGRDKETGKIVANASFHNESAQYQKDHRNCRVVLKWPRGHAKSTHADIETSCWLMFQVVPMFRYMCLVGKSEGNADKLLGDLQAELQFNRLIERDFGQQYNSGNWEDGEFVTKDNIAFMSMGRGQSPRGLRYKESRPDRILIDDLDDDELVKNPERVRELTEWVKTALFGALGAEGGQFIMVGNLISKCSVLANIIATPTVKTFEVFARDKNGNPAWPEYYTKERLRDIELFMGYRAFQKEYMHNPITEGAVFKHNWIRWKKPLALKDYDSIVAYCDPSFKSSGKNDYKAIKVWARPKQGIKGYSHTELHHLWAFVRQCSVSEMVRWFYDLHERLPEGVICSYFMESNFMQDTILDEFTVEGNIRGYQLPIQGDPRKKPDKFQRIEAISPLWERGFVFYNEDMKNDPDMTAGIEQTLSFEKGSRSHDDAPDADEGAIYKLQKQVRQESFTPSMGRRASSKNSW